MRKVIVDSTPLIARCNIGKLDILKKLYGEIIIPLAVYNEISAKGDSICKKEVDASLEWIQIGQIKNNLAKLMYKTQLHDGEVEVMILAQEENADLVIIDDKNAKKHAKYLKLNVTGTLGVLIKAKQLGFIQTLKPLLYELSNSGIYISSELIQLCLKQVNEQ